MKKINVVNIKCEGCKNGIIASLENIGLKNVDVDIKKQVVSFDGDEVKGSEKEKNFLTKTKSFLSCFRGKMK